MSSRAGRDSSRVIDSESVDFRTETMRTLCRQLGWDSDLDSLVEDRGSYLRDKGIMDILRENVGEDNVNQKYIFWYTDGPASHRVPMAILQVICLMKHRPTDVSIGRLSRDTVDVVLEIVGYLLSLGATPNSCFIEGRPLLFDLGMVHPDVGIPIAQLLLRDGADPFYKDEDAYLFGKELHYHDKDGNILFSREFSGFMDDIRTEIRRHRLLAVHMGLHTGAGHTELGYTGLGHNSPLRELPADIAGMISGYAGLDPLGLGS